MIRRIPILFLTFLLALAGGRSMAQCDADAGPNVTICQGESVVLGGNPTAIDPNCANVNYNWNNGGSLDDNNLANPTATPNTTTTYTVQLSGCGCGGENDQITVTVLPSPNANFTFGPNNACAGTPVNFVNTSTGCTGCQYDWDFDNPQSGASNSSTQANPSHVFVATGAGNATFNVSLTITSSNGCSDTQTTTVTVAQVPNAVLNEDVNFTQCLGFNDFYAYVTNASTPANNSNYYIDWGDGSPPYNSSTPPSAFEHVYSGVNIWDLTYIVTGTNGCTDEATYVVTNITNPAIGAGTTGNTLQCGPVDMCFDLTNWSNNHPSTVYVVDFGDGSAPQSFNHPPPASVCHSYSTSSCPGSYTFSVIADNNCPISSEATITPIQIYTPPFAQFTNPSSWCINTPAPFTNTSIPGYNLSCSSNASYAWNFGDPSSGPANTSTAASPTHTYGQAGTYTVTLVATNGGNPFLACGNTTFSGTICIETAPTPIFTVDTNLGCVPLNVNTDNTSNPGIPCSTTSQWLVSYSDLPCDPDNGAYSFVNATSSASLEPSFLLSSVGIYTLQLQMSNSCGVFTDTESITVNTVPVITMSTLPTICAGGSVSPSAAVDGCNLAILSYAWTMPGGSPATSTSSSPGSVTYAAAGNFNVGLTATNACGPASASTPLVVQALPIVSITSNDADNEVCSGSSVTLTANGASTYSWSGYGNGQSITVNPTSTTTYNVTGYSGSYVGCTDPESLTITVNPLPVPSPAATYTICAGQSVVIGANVVGGTGPYTGWNWTPSATLVGANTANPTATPPITTNYTVQVTDNEGCTGAGIVPVTVNALPAVNAGPDLVLCDQAVAENMTGQSPAGGNWIASCGGCMTAGGVFTSPGTGVYTATYTYTNASNCTNSDTRTITVVAPTAANAGPDHEYCQGTPAQQLVPITPGGTWSGNNVTAGGLYTPSTSGTFTLTYSLGVGSCLTSDQIQVIVDPLPVVNAGPNLTICAGDTIQINAGVSGGEIPYTPITWNNAATLSASNILNPLAFPIATTIYSLVVTDNNGCINNDQVQVSVNPSPVVNAGLDLTLCDQPIPQQLTGFSPTAGGTGTWTAQQGNMTAGGSYTPNGVGGFWAYYTFVNLNGCENTDSLLITVVGATPANAGPDDDICLNTPAVQLPTGGSWNGSPWVTAGGLFTPGAVGLYNLTFTTGVGTCLTSDVMQMEVLPLPLADAGPDQVICAGDVVQFNATGSSPNGPIVLYTWSGGTVSNPLLANPTATPAVNSTYNVTVVDSEGCADPDQITITVNPLPIVNAGNNLVLCDQAIPVVLTGYTPTVGGFGQWSGPGVTAGGTFTPNGTGIFSLYYTFTNANTCDNLDSIQVTVNAPVIADAGPDISICLNEGVYQLTGFVPAAGGTWSGTGIVNASTGLFNPVVSGAGTFVLTLQYGSGTCYTSDQMSMTVLPFPAVAAGPNQSICGNMPAFNLTGFSPAAGGTWEGPGITNSSIGTFNPGTGPGTYNLFYWYQDVNTGCADTSYKTVVVNPVPVANFALAPLGCTNSNVNIVNTSTGATLYSWDFGNGVLTTGFDPPYTYPDEGIFDIEMIASNNFGCQDTAMNANEIIDPPQADLILLPAEGCAPLTVSFDNLSIGQYLTYTWDLAIGSSTDPIPLPVTYFQGADDLYYPITLTATNFCGSDTDDDEVLVNPQPVAGFGTNLDVFCSPFDVVFNNTSVGNPDTYFWDFDDGSTSTVEEPGTHTFWADTVAVQYTITLYLANECGLDTTDYTITVLPNTVTAFFNTDITEGCAPLVVEFTDFSENGTVLQYDFDDGTFTGNPDPIHTFSQEGFYTVIQFVDNGCSFDTTQMTIEVFESPDLNFSVNDNTPCANDWVHFDADPGTAINLQWDFGDGTTSDLSDPDHQYSGNGNFTVTLTGENANGCTSSVTHPVNVYNAPDASFTIPDQIGCSPFTIAFSNGTNGGLFYSWDFGDGNTDNDANSSNTYYNTGSEPELYTVTLIATNMQLCADTFTMDVIVAPQPTSAFSLSAFGSCYYPQDVVATNFSQYANGYDWFVNGVLWSDNFETLFTFPDVGEYEVELDVSNQYGCSHSSTATYTIYPLPVVQLDATPLDGCVDLLVNFDNQSTGAESYLWSFGDGSQSVAQNPMHEYTNPGVYDITLVATTSAGCSDTLEMYDYVEAYNLPVANFTMSPEITTLYEPVIMFYDNSYDAWQWLWNFGDGTTGTNNNMEHTYAGTGVFPVTLTVWNDHGCEDKFNDAVLIEDLFNVYVPNAFTPDGDDINDYWKPAIAGQAFIEWYKLQIFDRWGTEVFVSDDPDEAWTGNVRDGGYFAKDDAYNWLITLHLIGSDEDRIFQGHVILVR